MDWMTGFCVACGESVDEAGCDRVDCEGSTSYDPEPLPEDYDFESDLPYDEVDFDPYAGAYVFDEGQDMYEPDGW